MKIYNNFKYKRGLTIFATAFIFILLLTVLISNSCTKEPPESFETEDNPFTLIMTNDSYIAYELSMPVGKPPLKDYYNAQNFGIRNKNLNNKYHLGEDWNGIGGGDTDLSDPVYSIGNGLVIFAANAGPGWGNVVMILHRLKNDKLICSLYGHLHDYHVKPGDFVKHRFQIGNIGNADGLYYAHLHFELREDISLGVEGGYSNSTKGYLNPTDFIISYNDQFLESPFLIKDGDSVTERFLTPPGFQRENFNKGSYENFIQNLPLKPYGHKVRYYNKKIKNPKGIYISVLDYDTGDRDLLQCADAVMLLRAEYFFNKSDFSNIHFTFLSDGKPRFYNSFGGRLNDYNNFRNYMNYIFSYANTASLIKELKPVNIRDVKPGDVFIQTGSPYGHAIIVIDTAVSASGKKMFMLAQSFMPAQEIQILINPTNSAISPWYRADSKKIITPEWVFRSDDLKRFNKPDNL
ncbi:MAG: peptidoglycan DD-metalloendopeptidase family protein [Spirochaetes bacterium]|nr:peptidoglycan DD-metalloendopeptidase family protein [Spirochaetota bacterium]MBN2771932.1 peptidoglycan DD-metalloendopeptidase family protein [Spirochaetota bacterium]